MERKSILTLEFYRNSSSECAEKASRSTILVGDMASSSGSIADYVPSSPESTCLRSPARTSLRRHPAGSAPRTTTTNRFPRFLLKMPVYRTRQPQPRVEHWRPKVLSDDRYRRALCGLLNPRVHRRKSCHGRRYCTVRNSASLFVRSCAPCCITSGLPSPRPWRNS